MNRAQLVEVKKGQEGTGLLLENDGFMSLDMPENKILRESIDSFKEGIAHDLPYPFVVSAVFQKYGIENANGRVYPENILKPAVEKYQLKIKSRQAYGQLNHPDDTAIDGERICMNIIELHWEGHTLVGKMEIPISEGFRRYGICSTLADIVAQWLISGLHIGVSSRGLGDVKQEFGHLVVQNYDLVCWDVVCEPSTPNAWIETSDEKLQPYLEGTDNNQDEKEVIKEDKYSKFDKWLND